ncbi:MAG: LysR family transcriptional regulator [Bdellovibrionaceae bacterium]|nr:LysR family transcriptional regulator [Bdellovibrio sp.]
MINQTDLKYFIELTKTLHVSRAAERLGVTQPTLSHCLKRLEVETKTELFIRSKKGLTLTAAGQRLSEQAGQLVSQWDEVMRSVQNETENVSGLIRLGCHSAVAQYTLPALLPQFLQKYPEINMNLAHGLSRHMTEDVISNKLDIAFAVNPVAHPDLIIKEIIQDRVTLWKSKKCLNADVLLIEPSLLQTQDLLRRLNKKGFSFNRVIESSSLEVLTQLVGSGAGYGILPTKVMNTLNDGGVTAVKDAPEFLDRICMIYKQEFRRLKRGATFIDFVQKTLSH